MGFTGESKATLPTASKTNSFPVWILTEEQSLPHYLSPETSL